MSLEGMILEALSRVIARLDALDRRIEDLKKDLEAFASTVYTQCASEYLNSKLTRTGLPAGVDAIAKTEKALYIIKFKIRASRIDAEKLERVAPHVAALTGLAEESLEYVPLIVTSRFEGEPPPSVRVIIC